MSHYVIRHKGELWWRPNWCGYTTELMAAGMYGEAEARRIESRRPPQDKAISLVEALRGLQARTVGDFLGANHYVKRTQYAHPRHPARLAYSTPLVRFNMALCEACGGPADFEGADRVQCDCGTTVCSACCVAYEGESFCSTDCALEMERYRKARSPQLELEES